MMKENSSNIIVQKTKAFAIRSIKLYQYLVETHKEYILSRQMLKSSTSIGANVKEGIRAQSKADFIAKFNIALKEASETEYWFELLQETGYIPKERMEDLYNECVEIIKILTTIIKNTNNSNS